MDTKRCPIDDLQKTVGGQSQQGQKANSLQLNLGSQTLRNRISKRWHFRTFAGIRLEFNELLWAKQQQIWHGP